MGDTQPYWYGGAMALIGVLTGLVGLYFYAKRKGTQQEQLEDKARREESDYAVQQARDALTRAVEEIERRDEQIDKLEAKHAREKEALEKRVCEAEDGHGACLIANATLRASLRFLISMARAKRIPIPADIEQAAREPGDGSEPHKPLAPEGMQ